MVSMSVRIVKWRKSGNKEETKGVEVNGKKKCPSRPLLCSGWDESSCPIHPSPLAHIKIVKEEGQEEYLCGICGVSVVIMSGLVGLCEGTQKNSQPSPSRMFFCALSLCVHLSSILSTAFYLVAKE